MLRRSFFCCLDIVCVVELLNLVVPKGSILNLFERVKAGKTLEVEGSSNALFRRNIPY